MGLFLSMSGIIGSSSAEIHDVFKSFELLTLDKKQIFGIVQVDKGTTNDPEIGIINGAGNNTTILYPANFMDWDAASQYLSAKLSKPVFSFHIHDEDLWMYILYNQGKEIDCFNPIPDYWQDDLPKEEKGKWKGNAGLISGILPSVSVDSIKNYLTIWDFDREGENKAYPEDEFPIGDCWQLSDFMKKVGLQYPIKDDGAICGDTFKFLKRKTKIEKVKEGSVQLKESDRKSWWKFW